MDLTVITDYLTALTGKAITWLSSTEFYSQVALSVICLFTAYSLATFIKRHTPLLNQPPVGGRILALRTSIYKTRTLLIPLLLILSFSIIADISDSLLHQSALVRFFLSLAMLYLLFSVINRVVQKQIFRKLAYWILIPIAVLHVFGWLDVVINYLESISIHLGNIKISAYGIARVLIFGTVLFWLAVFPIMPASRLSVTSKNWMSAPVKCLPNCFRFRYFSWYLSCCYRSWVLT